MEKKTCDGHGIWNGECHLNQQNKCKKNRSLTVYDDPKQVAGFYNMK